MRAIGSYSTATWYYLIEVHPDGNTYEIMATTSPVFASSIDPATTSFNYGIMTRQ